MNTEPTLIARTAALVLAGWLALIWISGAIYIAASFIESAGRLPWRPWRQTLRWLAREMWLVAWTQPLMPYFQLFNQRMGSGGGAVPVVMVHGYFQNRVDFLYVAHRLRKAGCGPLYAYNFFWPQNLTRSSEQVQRFVERLIAETGAPSVDLLTHSTGGLFALDIIASNPALVRRAVVIAIPAAGVPWRGPVLGRSGSQLRVGSLYHGSRSKHVAGVPVLSLYSSHDNLVHPVSTSELEGDQVRNVEIEGPGHLAVLFDKRVGDETVNFLLAEDAPASEGAVTLPGAPA